MGRLRVSQWCSAGGIHPLRLLEVKNEEAKEILIFQTPDWKSEIYVA